MKVKIKKLSDKAVTPKYSKPGDAGMDLTAISRKLVINDGEDADYIEYGTGLSIEIPKGYVGLLFPRSSISKKDITLCNSVGVLDSSYRGEVKFRFKVDASYNEVQLEEDIAICRDEISSFFQFIYNVGDRVGQLIILPYPQIEFEEVDELSETERGFGGFGSTNVK